MSSKGLSASSVGRRSRTLSTRSILQRLDFEDMSDEERDEKSSPHHTRSGRVWTEASGRARQLSRRRTRVRRSFVTKPVTDGDTADIEGVDEREDFSTSYSEADDRCCSNAKLSVYVSHQRSQLVAHSSPPRLLKPTLCTNVFEPLSSPTGRPFILTTSPTSYNTPILNQKTLLESPNAACSVRLSSSILPESNFISRSRLFHDDNSTARKSKHPPSLRLSKLRLSSHDKLPLEVANINPFTPVVLNGARRAQALAAALNYSSGAQSDCNGTSVSDYWPSEDGEESPEDRRLAAKRVKLTDINVERYKEEFLELDILASGHFGDVVKARHRLDGVVYAIKRTKKSLRRNSWDERVALNEVFAHAAMIKHKHIVRYFNAWVEAGHLYIQNEFCEGGSLDKQINECRVKGTKFAEEELKKLLLHISRGLQYIHNKRLVHLDVKPANILISLDDEELASCSSLLISFSPDSGAGSGECGAGSGQPQADLFHGPSADAVRYKLGDLGHVMSIDEDIGGSNRAEEGDCRYMAPEFLSMEPIPGILLPKCDIFSMGLAVYEAASLLELPRNSSEGPQYEELKAGKLGPLQPYSKDLRALLASLVGSEPAQRPHPGRIIAHPVLNPSAVKSKAQLRRELRHQTRKVRELEEAFFRENERVGDSRTTRSFVNL